MRTAQSWLTRVGVCLVGLVAAVPATPAGVAGEPVAVACEPAGTLTRAFVSPADAGGHNDSGDGFGAALASGDFNGDGRADLAVGAPSDAVGGVRSGTVSIFYGSAPAGSARMLVQQAAGGRDEDGDRFGAALAVGDFNVDGLADLIVGAPGEDVGTATDAGMTFVFAGSSTGLSTGFVRDQASAGGQSEAGDNFGAALAVGDVTADGVADAVVGTPGEAPGSRPTGGAVAVLPGRVGGGYFRTQEDAGGTTEAGDRFGAAVAVGDVNGDRVGDVVVGTPGEAPGSLAAGGAVAVLPGSSGGPGGGWFRTQEDARGLTESGDGFGSAVAAGDANADGLADVAVGAPGEDIGSTADAGAVFVLRGGPGLTGYVLSQYAAGEIVEAGDRFGAAVTLADLDADRHADLVAGAPGEAPQVPGGAVGDSDPASGAVFLFGGGSRHPDVGRRLTQRELQAASEAGDRFGAAVGTGDYNGDGRAELIVGATGEAIPGQPESGAVAVVVGLTAGVSLGGLVGAASDRAVRIWGRTTRSAALRVQYRPAGSSTWTTSAAVTPDAGRDLTGVVDLTGLTPGTTYDYRLAVDCLADPLTQATFRTLPAAGVPGTFRFTFTADLEAPSVGNSQQSFAGFDAIAAHNPDFMILGGDQMYADHGPLAETTDEFYAKYRENWAETYFRHATARVPTFMTWDDHEIRNDWRSGTAAPYPAARAAGVPRRGGSHDASTRRHRRPGGRPGRQRHAGLGGLPQPAVHLGRHRRPRHDAVRRVVLLGHHVGDGLLGHHADPRLQ